MKLNSCRWNVILMIFWASELLRFGRHCILMAAHLGEDGDPLKLIELKFNVHFNRIVDFRRSSRRCPRSWKQLQTNFYVVLQGDRKSVLNKQIPFRFFRFPSWGSGIWQRAAFGSHCSPSRSPRIADRMTSDWALFSNESQQLFESAGYVLCALVFPLAFIPPYSILSSSLLRQSNEQPQTKVSILQDVMSFERNFSSFPLDFHQQQSNC